MAVADRHCERVGGIIGLRDFFEIEDFLVISCTCFFSARP